MNSIKLRKLILNLNYHRVKLTRDLISINMFVLNIIDQVNEIYNLKEKEKEQKMTNNKVDIQTENANLSEEKAPPDQTTPDATQSHNEKSRTKRERNISLLLFVILEICIRDLIKYVPNLMKSTQINEKTLLMSNKMHPTKTTSPNNNTNINKSSFLYMNVSQCKLLSNQDVELLKRVISILNTLPFHKDLSVESS
jgi:hypothetical protein